MTVRALALALVLVGCGAPSGPTPRAPSSRPPTVEDASTEPVEPTAPAETVAGPAEPGPCAARPPSHDSLADPRQPGLLVVDAAAPRELGACISPRLALREGPIACEPSGLRCRVGERHVLLAREVDDACVPTALVAYAELAPGGDAPEIAAALAMRDEACALHDRVVEADPALYDTVERARRIAPGGRRRELEWQCLTGAEARAFALEARARFASVPLRCAGLRCRVEADLPAEPTPALPEGTLFFAHRLAGPLRFDGAAWLRSPDDLPRALELLRRRCR